MMRCCTFGRVHSIGADDPALDSWLQHAFSGLEAERGEEPGDVHWLAPAPAGRVQLQLNGESVLAPVEPTDAVLQLVQHLTSLGLSAGRTGLLLHGAGLTRAGAAVIAVAPSGTGKSTFTLTALAEGSYGYLTDETVRFDLASQQVTGFAKPIGLKPGSQARFSHLDPQRAGLPSRYAGEQWLIAAADAGAASVGGAATLAATVLLARDREAGSLEQPRLERLHPAEGAVLLAAESSYLLELAEPLEALASVVEAAPLYRLRYWEADEAVALLGSLL